MVPPNFKIKKLDNLPKSFTKIWINDKIKSKKLSYNNTSEIHVYICYVVKNKIEANKCLTDLYNKVYFNRKSEAKLKSNYWYKSLDIYFKDNKINPKSNIYFS